MIDNNGMLLHSYRQGEASINGNLDDYAFIISALIDLYEASFKTEYLTKALHLNSELIKRFWDNRNGGFFFTSHEAELMIARQKEIYDGAIPSGNSAEMMNLIRLGRMTSSPELEHKAFETSRAFSRQLSASPSNFSYALCALDFAFGPSNEIVITGGTDSEVTKQFILSLKEFYIPSKIVILNSGDEIKRAAPFLVNQIQIGGKPTAYVCRNYVCSLPVNKIEDFKKLLKKL